MSDNGYNAVVARMTDEDLLIALSKHDRYIDEVLVAMLDEMDRRNLSINGSDALRAALKARYVPGVVDTIDVVEEIPVSLPVFFSQTAILAFTIFFSPLFGGVLLALNVKKTNKNAVWQIVLFSLVFTAFSGYVSYYLAPGSFISLLIPVAGALLLSEVLWNNYIGKNIKYEKRSVMIPLIVAAIIAIPVCFYVYKHPELFQITN